MKILIVYYSKTGKTRKVAEMIAKTLQQEKYRVETLVYSFLYLCESFHASEQDL